MSAAKPAAVEAARAAWEPRGGCPDWVVVLAKECDRTSQRAVAARIGYSAGAVCQVLADKYNAPTTNIELAVRGAYLAATVVCPVLGEMPADRCQEHQRRPWSSSPMRLRLYKACRSGCPHSRIETTTKEAS